MTASVPRSPGLRLLGLALLMITVAAIPGCGGTGSTSVPLFPCSGQVLADGKPLEGVQVTFRPASGDGQDSQGPVPIGKTDKDGKFRLTTTVGADGLAVDGAPAGDYLIGLVAARRSDSVDFLRKDAAQAAPAVDRRFADPKTSGFKATVKAGENALEPFDVKNPGRSANAPLPPNRN